MVIAVIVAKIIKGRETPPVENHFFHPVKIGLKELYAFIRFDERCRQ